MAFIQCSFFSEVLRLSTSMTVILPEQTQAQIGLENNQRAGKHPTLYLLHGLSDDNTIWTRRTSIERYAAEYGIAVVMPQADHSFYSNMKYGKNYWTFLTEELPQKARAFFPLSDKREDNFVAGLSMGGYGAFKWALNFPEKFAAAASLSGAVEIVGHVQRMREANSGQGLDLNQPLSLVFGEDNIAETENDLLWLLNKVDKSDQEKPILYQACGTEDFLYNDNLAFFDVCKQTSFELKTDFGPGDHNWGYWDEKIQDVLKWLPIK